MDYKNYTWTINNIDPKYTWETNWSKTNSINGIPSITVTSTDDQTDESMIEEILGRTDDQGFFKDLVSWLSVDAPKKVRRTLKEFASPMHTGIITYERLCEVVYRIGFRASELIERRMILGPSNQWVAEYFKDFPANSRSE